MGGGGRDWFVEPETGKIRATHDAELILGITPFAQLILVERSSPEQIIFDREQLESLKNGTTVDLQGLTLLHEDKDEKENSIRSWLWSEIGANKEASVEGVSFIKNNFLSIDIDGNSFALLSKDDTVVFVRAMEGAGEDTFQSGRGRDWTLNSEDGTISPKANPNLVLGAGSRKLILTKDTSGNGLIFDESVTSGLRSGEYVTLAGRLASDNEKTGPLFYIAKAYDTARYFKEWRYIESVVISDEMGEEVPSSSVSVKLVEENFLFFPDEKDNENGFAFDVSFWIMAEGNTVNFVEGTTLS